MPLGMERVGESVNMGAIQQRQKVMNQNPAKELVAEAKRIARKVDSWIELSNALSDPQRGLMSRYFPDTADRQAFLSSPEYEEIDQLLLRTIKRTGLYPHAGNGRNGASG